MYVFADSILAVILLILGFLMYRSIVYEVHRVIGPAMDAGFSPVIVQIRWLYFNVVTSVLGFLYSYFSGNYVFMFVVLSTIAAWNARFPRPAIRSLVWVISQIRKQVMIYENKEQVGIFKFGKHDGEWSLDPLGDVVLTVFGDSGDWCFRGFGVFTGGYCNVNQTHFLEDDFTMKTYSVGNRGCLFVTLTGETTNLEVDINTWQGKLSGVTRRSQNRKEDQFGDLFSAQIVKTLSSIAGSAKPFVKKFLTVAQLAKLISQVTLYYLACGTLVGIIAAVTHFGSEVCIAFKLDIALDQELIESISKFFMSIMGRLKLTENKVDQGAGFLEPLKKFIAKFLDLSGDWDKSDTQDARDLSAQLQAITALENLGKKLLNILKIIVDFIKRNVFDVKTKAEIYLEEAQTVVNNLTEVESPAMFERIKQKIIQYRTFFVHSHEPEAAVRMDEHLILVEKRAQEFVDKFLKVFNDDIKQFNATAVHLLKTDIKDWTHEDIEHYADLMEEYLCLSELVVQLDRSQIKVTLPQETTRFYHSLKQMQGKVSKKRSEKGYRPEPILLMLESKPNQGKTFLTSVIVDAWLTHYGLVTVDEHGKTVPNLSYLCTAHPDANGRIDHYNQDTEVMINDELFQIKDADQCAKVTEFLIKTINVAPNPMPTAIMDDKGANFVHPKLFVFTTNSKDVFKSDANKSVVKQNGALRRRVYMQVSPVLPDGESLEYSLRSKSIRFHCRMGEHLSVEKLFSWDEFMTNIIEENERRQNNFGRFSDIKDSMVSSFRAYFSKKQVITEINADPDLEFDKPRYEIHEGPSPLQEDIKKGVEFFVSKLPFGKSKTEAPEPDAEEPIDELCLKYGKMYFTIIATPNGYACDLIARDGDHSNAFFNRKAHEKFLAKWSKEASPEDIQRERESFAEAVKEYFTILNSQAVEDASEEISVSFIEPEIDDDGSGPAPSDTKRDSKSFPNMIRTFALWQIIKLVWSAITGSIFLIKAAVVTGSWRLIHRTIESKIKSYYQAHKKKLLAAMLICLIAVIIVVIYYTAQHRAKIDQSYDKDKKNRERSAKVAPYKLDQGEDVQGSQIINSVTNKSMRNIAVGGVRVNAFGLAGCWYTTVGHLFEGVKPDDIVTMYNPRDKTGSSKLFKDLTVIYPETGDMCFFMFPNHYTTDIRKFVATERELVIMANRRYMHPVSVVTLDEFMTPHIEHIRDSVHDSAANVSSSSGRFVTRGYLKTDVYLSDGSCGSPYFSRDPSFNTHRITHLHSGWFQNHSVGEVITQELIERHIGNKITLHDAYEQDGVKLDQRAIFVDDNLEALERKPPGTNFIGQVRPQDAVRLQTKSDIVRSLLEGETETAPLRLRKFVNKQGDVKVPLDYAFNKMRQYPGFPVDKDHIRRLTGKRHWPVHILKSSCLDDSIVLNGKTGSHLHTVPASTSAGYGHRKEVRSGKFPLIYWDDEYKFSPEMKSHLDAYIDRMKKTKNIPYLILRDQLKDERKELEAVNAGKSRIFSGTYFTYWCAFRKYFGSWLDAHRAQAPHGPSMVGINATGRMWNDLWRFLINLVSPRFINGDYSGFDLSLPYLVRLLDLEDILDWYSENCEDCTEEDQMIRWLIFHASAHHVHIINDIISGRSNSMDSGNPATAELNSEAGVRLVMACFVSLGLKNKVGNEVQLRKMFWEKCRTVVYGDDNLIAVSEGLDWFNQISLRDELKLLFGMKYTSATKGEFGSNDYYTPLKEVTFLKRYFRPLIPGGSLYTGTVAGVMPYSLCVETAKWVRVSAGPKTLTTKENMIASLREVFFHGEYKYNETLRWYNDVLRKHRVEPIDLPYNSLLESYKRS